MKKILFAFSMIFALVSCVSEDLPQANIPQEGDKVTLTFGVQIPEAGVATRTMASPAINSLQVLVFDYEGYFVEKAAATLVGTTSDAVTPTDPTKRQQFTVTLTKTSQARNIHFVANCPDAGNVSFGHEDAIISGLTVSGDADAYWQRMSFADGIASGIGTNFNNNTLIPLVRNFARISVTESANNFELTGFYVVNTRAAGRVAPYAQNKGEFVEYTKADADNGFVAKTYQELVADAGYVGFEAGEMAGAIESVNVGANNYVYVRETAVGSDPYIIVKGSYNGGAETYYKLAFMLDLNGTKQPAAILRNFSYEFNITSVAKAGYSTYDEACAAEAENNLSFNTATQSLLNISDGTSQLFVNATSVTLVTGDVYYLLYKYIPTIGSDADNSQVSISLDTQDVTSPIFNTVGTTGTVANLITTTTDAELKAYYEEYNDYNYVILDPIDPQGTPLSQNVIVSAGDLARTVNFTLRQKSDMTVVVYDGAGDDKTDKLVPQLQGEAVNVDITIPKGLSQSIFPLKFVIEAEELSISPDATKNNLPVVSGASIIPNKTASTFGFVKTYTWDEYVAAGGKTQDVTITTYFRTNKANSASEVYVDNMYFNQDSDSFENSEPEYFTNLTFSASGANLNNGNRTVTITCGSWSQTFTLNSNGSATNCTYDLSGYNLTKNMNVTISGSYDTGNNWNRITHSVNYTTTLGSLNGSNITLTFSN